MFCLQKVKNVLMFCSWQTKLIKHLDSALSSLLFFNCSLQRTDVVFYFFGCFWHVQSELCGSEGECVRIRTDRIQFVLPLSAEQTRGKLKEGVWRAPSDLFFRLFVCQWEVSACPHSIFIFLSSSSSAEISVFADESCRTSLGQNKTISSSGFFFLFSFFYWAFLLSSKMSYLLSKQYQLLELVIFIKSNWN